MLNLSKRYRKDYAGEDIITERVLENREWVATTEYVPNNVINNQISNRAVVFGNGLGRKDFDIPHILRHRSGLLGADALQSYACNAFYRDYAPDFLIVTDRLIAKEITIMPSRFWEDNIVYTRATINLEFPKKFYLIPNDIYTDAGTTALYIAAFDGHKRIYMCGFDGQDTPSRNNNIYAGTNCYDPIHVTQPISDAKWEHDRTTLFNTYDDVDFVFVTMWGRNRLPEAFKYCPNVRQISRNDWIVEADL